MRGKPRPGSPPARHPAVRCGTGALAKSLTESRLLYLSDTIRQRPWRVQGEPCTVAAASSCVTLQLCGHFALCDARSLHTQMLSPHACSSNALSTYSLTCSPKCSLLMLVVAMLSHMLSPHTLSHALPTCLYQCSLHRHSVARRPALPPMPFISTISTISTTRSSRRSRRSRRSTLSRRVCMPAQMLQG